MLDYAVLYCSETGNTKQVAFQIFSALPGQDKDILSLDEIDTIPEAKTYFVGFFVNKGTCSVEVIRCLEHLGGKNIALFGTCGSSPTEEYKKMVENQVSVWIEGDNTYLGMFLCQGKMPIQIRRKYEDMRTAQNARQVERLLANFDEAMLHPGEKDFEAARQFAREMAGKVQKDIVA
ncbi:MAG: flavodoxin [Lachnospiraceae bacterium]|nr:flavodoxin [Lachnospiraceae bacterium]